MLREKISFCGGVVIVVFSGGCTPMRLKVSVSKVCLILLSNGEVELRLGHTLTSSSQGLRVSSMSTSNP